MTYVIRRCPIPLGQTERLAVFRILVGAYATLFLVIRFPHLWDAVDRPTRMWEPIGVLSPLNDVPDPRLVRMALLVTVVCGVLFTIGIAFRVTGPTFAVLFLAVTTFRLSWGSVLHTEHVVVVHVLLIGFCPAAAGAYTPKRSALRATRSDPWALQIAALVTVLGYFVSGITKLRIGGLDWLSGDALRNQVAFDNVRKTLLGDASSPLAAWAVRNDSLFALFAPLTIAVELLAPLALIRSRFRVVWIASAWSFHVGVLALMAILFPYQLSAIAFAPLLLLPRNAR